PANAASAGVTSHKTGLAIWQAAKTNPKAVIKHEHSPTSSVKCQSDRPATATRSYSCKSDCVPVLHDATLCQPEAGTSRVKMAAQNAPYDLSMAKAASTSRDVHPSRAMRHLACRGEATEAHTNISKPPQHLYLTR